MTKAIYTIDHEGFKCEVYRNQSIPSKGEYILYIEDELMNYFNIFDFDDLENQLPLFEPVSTIFKNLRSLMEKINNFLWIIDRKDTELGGTIYMVAKDDVILFREFEKLFMQSFNKEYDFIDNYRIADPSNEEQVAIYTRKAQSGCCGSYDKKHEVMGKIYMVGFNHGH